MAFWKSLPSSPPAQFTNVIPPPPRPFDMTTIQPDTVLVKTFTGPTPSADIAWTPEWRQADIGAANGHGNARSIALLQSIVSNDGVAPDGTKYLSTETIDQIFQQQADGVDQVLQLPVRFGIGYALPSDSSPHLPADRKICYWGGWGGSSIVNVVDRNMTVAYMMNRMAEGLLGDTRGFDLVSAALAATN